MWRKRLSTLLVVSVFGTFLPACTIGSYWLTAQREFSRLFPPTPTVAFTPAIAYFLPPPPPEATAELEKTPTIAAIAAAATATPIRQSTALPSLSPTVAARTNGTITATPKQQGNVTKTPTVKPAATATPTTAVVAAATPASIAPTATPLPPPEPSPITSLVNPATVSLPASFRIPTVRHESQSMNNCGPATVAMQLSTFGRKETQYQTQTYLRPDKDDRNVSPNEMAAYAQTLGFRSKAIVGGTIPLLKQLLLAGMSPVVETWFIPHVNDEMGHYRLLIGYEGDTLIFHDSYNGPNIRIKEAEFDQLWKVFNRVAVVTWTRIQEESAVAILQSYLDDNAMTAHALSVARAEAAANPQDKFAWFNVGTNLLTLGDTAGAVQAYNRARRLNLPWRMLWYQFGPYEAYLAEKQYDEVIKLANATLTIVTNLEESYYWRGRAYSGLGNTEAARRDYATAVRLNANFAPAKKALAN
ncbi:MAG: C39 family peptidase [Anaerolineae bacterium]|nr:C39 family peptidase [Anaerolineae bacterium]